MADQPPFYAIDLFAGCGGLSEGFAQAGLQVIADVEMNGWACESLRTRHLYYELARRHELALYFAYVMGQTSKEAIYGKMPGLQETVEARVIHGTLIDKGVDGFINRIDYCRKFHGTQHVHVLLGGPPCQPYSVIGRARDPDRMEKDDRHYLYRHYLDILRFFQPDFFVYENVPGLFSAQSEGKMIFNRLQEDFYSLDPAYEITPPLREIRERPSSYILNSRDFGVPQQRRRLILIGYRKSLEPVAPNVRSVFANLQSLAEERKTGGWVNVLDAIGDLPRLHPGEGSDRYFGPYDGDAASSYYRKEMRHLSPGVLNHKARTHMCSDLARYRFFIEHHKNGSRAAKLSDLIRIRPDLAPSHRNLDHFGDRFRVQWWDSPSSTITAHISKDGHYYIHPDITQCRSFTVREAARCQSFPDNYFFEGPRTEQFKQVGNAVPPLLARAVASSILDELKRIYER